MVPGGAQGTPNVGDSLRQILATLENAHIPLPLTAALDIATGALLAVFANATGTTPGTQLVNSKVAAVRWNNDAAPGAIAISVPVPPDLDPTMPATFYALVSKTGATVGDASKLTVGAFLQVPGALHDADTDFGGDTTAIAAPTATAKTLSSLSLTLAAADLATAAGGGLTVTIKPKAGTLGTDDLILAQAWIAYTRR